MTATRFKNLTLKEREKCFPTSYDMKFTERSLAIVKGYL